MKLEPSKEKPHATSAELLGASVDIGNRHVSAALAAERKTDYVALLRVVLARGALTPAAAPKIRGKLGFAQSLVFGKSGRVMMKDFATLQYSSLHGPWFPHIH